MDSRFRALHKENGGVSSARNAGLSQARGEWILFADSDDLLSISALETLSAHLKSSNVDMAYFNVRRYMGPRGRKRLEAAKLTLSDGEIFPESAKKFAVLYALCGNKTPRFSGPSYVETFFDFRSVCIVAWRKAFLEREKLRFYEDLHIGEDMQFNIAAFLRARNGVLYLDSTLYFYRFNPDSAMNRYQPNAMRWNQRLWERIRETLGPMTSDEETQYALIRGYVMAIMEIVSSNISHPDNPKPRSRRLEDLKAFVRSEPYRTAVCTCRLRDFPWKRQILFLLLRMKWENLFLTLTDIRFSRR